VCMQSDGRTQLGMEKTGKWMLRTAQDCHEVQWGQIFSVGVTVFCCLLTSNRYSSDKVSTSPAVLYAMTKTFLLFAPTLYIYMTAAGYWRLLLLRLELHRSKSH